MICEGCESAVGGVQGVRPPPLRVDPRHPGHAVQQEGPHHPGRAQGRPGRDEPDPERADPSPSQGQAHLRAFVARNRGSSTLNDRKNLSTYLKSPIN